MMAAEIRKRTISGSPDELDAAGFFPVPGETDEQFASRLETLSGELEALRDGSSDLLPLLRQSRPLSREVRDAANQLTWETYRFRADWVAGWYSSRRTGLFSAGILLEVDGALPLLFLHGTADTNVPIGESIQMFTALKLLGRETAFVTIDGENHLITDYRKRILWQNTIFAWFAKYLQGDSTWWDTLYPERTM